MKSIKPKFKLAIYQFNSVGMWDKIRKPKISTNRDKHNLLFRYTNTLKGNICMALEEHE